MKKLSIEMIPAQYCRRRPADRSERAFATHQDRLPKELAVMAIRHGLGQSLSLRVCRFNAEFARPGT